MILIIFSSILPYGLQTVVDSGFADQLRLTELILSDVSYLKTWVFVDVLSSLGNLVTSPINHLSFNLLVANLCFLYNDF